MRRKIDLYIGGERVDLSTQSLILMNWTQEDASNPTAIVSPYSQQVTLPGTPANNRIFGDIWRPDRTTTLDGSWTGASFDALRKTPFAIYADTGEILQSGYVRLDSVDRKGPRVSYKVTLFGDIGSFFYGLSQNDDGSAMTLADLDFTPAGGVSELDFRITAANVLAAWADLSVSTDPLWTVVNFAPAYEGIPDKDFDATKGIADPDDINLLATHTDGGDFYTTWGSSGKCLVNLPSIADEWAVKDLRSYLQRPVVNFGKVLEAIRRKASDLGYSLDLSTLDSGMGDYRVGDIPELSKMWLTLPQLSTLAPVEITGTSLTKSGGVQSANPLATWSIGGTIPSGTKINVTIRTQIEFSADSANAVMRVDSSRWSQFAVFFLQLTGWYGGTKLAESKILPVNIVPGMSAKDAYTILGGTGNVTDDSFANPVYGLILDPVDPSTSKTDELSLDLEGYDFTSVKLEILRYGFLKWDRTGGGAITKTSTDGAFGIPFLTGFNTFNVETSAEAQDGDVADDITFNAPSTVRSGALVTKRLLLGASKTPADYLISFAKSFGLYFVIDNTTKAVTLCKRSEFFNGSTIDLTRRIDKTSVTIKPVAVDSKWYEFSQDTKGAFEDEYESAYGATYASQKVNTGYEFNDNVKDIISNNALRGAVTALERSKYFNYIVTGGSVFVPSLFLDTGVTYTLWTTDGKSIDIPVQTPASTSVTVTYYNPSLNGYDADGAAKLQLHSSDGNGVAGEDVLVFLIDVQIYPYFKVTDDSAVMTTITGGKGCWDIGPGAAAGIYVPVFGRYTYRYPGNLIGSALEFGEPREMSIPGVYFEDGNDRTLYGRAWRSYLRDRYDGDTKVMVCNVDLAGMRVDAGLLRNFYWYEGATWVLNKINNHAVTTHAPTQCELVQVQDKTAYTNGQNFA